VEVLRQTATFKIPHPRKDIKLHKKSNLKTVYLDLDETLIHCD
jgi:predicted HAD superfamily phosphohydrolase YqeG